MDTEDYLDPMKASFSPATMTIKGSSVLKYSNILVGEVWVCSGQSNMGWSVGQSDDKDLESMSANYPSLRLISVPQFGTQEAQKILRGNGKQLHLKQPSISPQSVIFSEEDCIRFLEVPVGLIDNAWGGSACEAWIPRDRLNKLAVAKPYMDQWKMTKKHSIFQNYKKHMMKN